jgi:hypothetical protein
VGHESGPLQEAVDGSLRRGRRDPTFEGCDRHRGERNRPRRRRIRLGHPEAARYLDATYVPEIDGDLDEDVEAI